MQVDLDRHIPEELYRAVAEILAFVYFLENKATGADFEFESGWRAVKTSPDTIPVAGILRCLPAVLACRARRMNKISAVTPLALR
jgi:hypothetical protein